MVTANLFFITEWWLCNQLVPVCEPAPNLFLNGKGESIKFCFHQASGELKENKLEALQAYMGIFIFGPDVCHVFLIKKQSC